MSIGTAMVLIALGVFFYLKPAIFKGTAKWSAVALGVAAVSFGGWYGYQHLPRKTAATLPLEDCMKISTCNEVNMVRVFNDKNSKTRISEPKIEDFKTITEFSVALAEWIKTRGVIDSAIKTEPNIEGYQTLSAYEHAYGQWLFNQIKNPPQIDFSMLPAPPKQ
jgi:hypothetical protein